VAAVNRAEPRVMRVKRFFATISSAALGRVAERLARDARFKNPFNRAAAIGRDLGRRSAQVDAPRIGVHDAAIEDAPPS
jgi:hypothetical protein